MATDLLRVDITDHDEITLRGELDAATAHQLVELVGRIPAGGDPVVLDLSELVFIDASGVRSLAAVASAEPARRVVAVSTRPNVAGVLRLLAGSLPPNLSVEPVPVPGRRPVARSRLAVSLAFTRNVAEANRWVRWQIALGLRRLRRLRRRIARTHAASRRFRASDAAGSR